MGEVVVTAKGPMFDGRAVVEVDKFVAEAVSLVATRAKQEVDSNLAGSLKHPTGHYQGSINIAAQGLNMRVNDGMVIYGPWLEGVGSRNAPVTVFKGYSSFRRAAQTIQGEVPAIVEPAMSRLIGGLQ